MAFTAGVKIVSTIQLSNKYLITFDITGPTSYSRTTGIAITAATGGLNMSGFEFVDCTMDTTAVFQLEPQLNLAGFGNAVPSVILRPIATATGSAGGQSQTAGTEAANSTNLSTFSFRIQAFCV